MSLGISLPRLQFFSIAYNRFTGCIPTSLSNVSNLSNLQLTSNNLTGRVPSLEKVNKVWALRMGLNYLGTGKADDLKFLRDLTNATDLTHLDIGDNNFGGKLPVLICNFSRKLETLLMQDNQIFGNIPTGLELLVDLNSFVIEGNIISGTIPYSIGKLKNLNLLDLERNSLTGNIPSSIGNMTNLIEIFLSYNNLQGLIPSSLGNCQALLTLNLSNNDLAGPIPLEILGLSSLSIGLDLSYNHFRGSLPNAVGNLKQLGLLALEHNMISGQIPRGLGSCQSLEVLNISHNLFQGSIPPSLSSLKNIMALDLSHNNLSGNIPEFLPGFIHIEQLDISYNDFEGMIPSEGIFRNASGVSVKGNKHLCGGIHALGLPACKPAKLRKELSVKLKTVISVSSAFASIAVVLLCTFLWKSRKIKRGSTPETCGNALLRLSYQSLLKATDGFSEGNLIGSGSFGSVYKGILDEGGQKIAVKLLHLLGQGASKSFEAECQVLRTVRHRNLVKVLTACSGVDYHGNDFKALVYEYMENGNLKEWLHPTMGSDSAPRTLTVVQRLNIAIDVASALDYLHHHCETPIVHCDLKPNNILLNEEMTGHVSDFGLVKFLPRETLSCSMNQSSSIGLRGTIGYCPPEYGMGSQVSTSGDVFSFGTILLEMFTGKSPTDAMFGEGLSLHSYVKGALPEQVAEIVDANLLRQMQLNNYHIEYLISILEIGISCSVESSQEVLHMDYVIAQLSSVRRKFARIRGLQ